MLISSSLENEIKFFTYLFNDIFLYETCLNLESTFGEFKYIFSQVLLLLF